MGWRLCVEDPDFTVPESGITQAFILPGDVFRVCYADADVEMLGTDIRSAPPYFAYTPGEPVFHDNGTQLDTEGVLVSFPVSRDDDGRLIAGWRDCEEVDEIPKVGDGVIPRPAIIVD